MSIEHISVAFLGVDQRSRSAYQLFFKNITDIHYDIVEDFHKADLCLVDKDSYKVKQEFEELMMKESEQYVLSISILEQPCPDNRMFFLKKPIKKNEFHDLLNRISNLILTKEEGVPSSILDKSKKTVETISKALKNNGSCKKSENDSVSVVKTMAELPDESKENIVADNVVQINSSKRGTTATAGKLLKIKNEEYYVGERPDVDVTNPEELKQIYYSPDTLMQGIVEAACEKSRDSGRIVKLDVLNHVFYFDYAEQRVYTSTGRAVIRPLCVIRHGDEVTYSIMKPGFKDDLHTILNMSRKASVTKSLDDLSTDMDAFKWIISLWCSRGRIPAGMDITQPVYLRQWPNLTRLEDIPHSVRISALLYEHPRTLVEAARQLGIEQRYIFAFFSACRSITLSDVSRREVDKLFAPEIDKNVRNKSILSRLLGRLIRFSENSSKKEAAK